MPELRGRHYCMSLETLLTLNYNSFILTVGIIGVDSLARDMYGNSHSQGTWAYGNFLIVGNTIHT